MVTFYFKILKYFKYFYFLIPKTIYHNMTLYIVIMTISWLRLNFISRMGIIYLIIATLFLLLADIYTFLWVKHAESFPNSEREHKIMQQNVRDEAESESDPPWVALLGHISTCLTASLMLGCVLHWQWVSPRYTGSDSTVETEEEQQGPAWVTLSSATQTHTQRLTLTFAHVFRWAWPKRYDLKPNPTYWILRMISKNLFSPEHLFCQNSHYWKKLFHLPL